MPLDRARIEYLIEDLKTRPERVRVLQRTGVVVGFLFIALITFLLARGSPVKKAKPKLLLSDQPKPLSQGMQDAFATAKAAEPLLRNDPRFARVYFVPSAATSAQKFGKIVVMGEMNSEEDLHALQLQMMNIAVSVPLDWQVSLPGPR
jgi:hypothetical protein